MVNSRDGVVPELVSALDTCARAGRWNVLHNTVSVVIVDRVNSERRGVVVQRISISSKWVGLCFFKNLTSCGFDELRQSGVTIGQC